MAIEIERKFLVDTDRLTLPSESMRICQGYFATADLVAIRVRIKGDEAYLTVKGPTEKLQRLEFEYPIPMEDADEMLGALCQKPFIEKRRYLVNHQQHCYEIDVFEGDNAGLIFAEVELEDENDELSLPSWIGKEITEDPRYFNSSLIHHPYSRW